MLYSKLKIALIASVIACNIDSSFGQVVQGIDGNAYNENRYGIDTKFNFDKSYLSKNKIKELSTTIVVDGFRNDSGVLVKARFNDSIIEKFDSLTNLVYMAYGKDGSFYHLCYDKLGNMVFEKRVQNSRGHLQGDSIYFDYRYKQDKIKCESIPGSPYYKAEFFYNSLGSLREKYIKNNKDTHVFVQQL